MSNFKPLIPINSYTSDKLKLGITNFDDEGRLLLQQPYFARIIAFQIQTTFYKNIFPGKLNSLAILDGLFDFLINKFDDELSPKSVENAFDYLLSNLSSADVKQILKIYLSNFPLKGLFDKKINEEYLSGFFTNDKLKELFIRNLILVFLTNQNKAVQDAKFIFDDHELISSSKYTQAIKILKDYFDKIRIEPLKNKSLIEFLFEPIIISSENIEGQLEFIRQNWKHIIPEDVINQILRAIDLIKEDEKIFQKGFGPGETKVPTFSLEELLGFGDKLKASFYPVTPIEEEKFTPDTDWMPKVVLLAKNTYVWLYQLSKKYNREIKTLDQIPDEELDLLSSYGFNALWLIGIWERSPASRKIKQLSGNPEALASAYSIYDYVIANDLGGEEAYQNLNERCWKRGIRLACDIVPNHMGIYSKWIIEHPDYFIQSDYPPFPSYSFTGPDLSEHPDFQIRIEDKYWTRQDAAVVFQLIENKTGKVRYIYHGNDGTSMPWNDTAQLNLLKPEVREALYQLILNIAKKFSIIRLDAAMTLTQKHYQRLWFPVPGTGGAIPSRTDFSMSTDEFLEKYPKEFWREVIDRINIDKPDTLLLAEAFWLMEGYFVRTLGMHRVYNSAFMNMLKNEENAKYRDLISNTLEFNPEILKRYVNFLSNPDEETAINQFGDGDKYFGCCVMMVTMPGLPMFAHGQIEGLKEKYGHEYYRSYYDEIPNEYLIDRHRREIFPLMKKRYLFSQVENFELYDFKNEYGDVIENIFAYSNRSGNERALVFYNNSYSTYYGYIDYSHPKNYGSSESEADKKLISKSLGEALGIKNSENHFYIFREVRTNLEFIRRGSDLYNQKFFVELKGYEYKVFLDFVELFDESGELAEFYNSISFTGFQSISQQLVKFRFSKIVNELSKVLNKEIWISSVADDKRAEIFIDQFRESFKNLYDKIELDRLRFEYENLNIIKTLQVIISTFIKLRNRKTLPKKLKKSLETDFNEISVVNNTFTLFTSILLNEIKKYSKLESSTLDILTKEIINQHFGYSDKLHIEAYEIVLNKLEQSKILEFSETQLPKMEDLLKFLMMLLNDNAIQEFLYVNEYEGEVFYSKEKFEEFLQIVSYVILLGLVKKIIKLNNRERPITIEDFKRIVELLSNYLQLLKKTAQETSFYLKPLLRILEFIVADFN